MRRLLWFNQGPQPSLILNFLTGSLDSRISFTRAANTATFFGSNLLLQTANANIPRFDYNPLTGALNGLLIEQASTNVAIQNRDRTNAAWVKVTTTAALDQTGIDGTANSASSLTATGGNATTLQTVVHVSSTDTYSVYIKRITGTGEIDISTDGTTWTNVTAQINSSSYSRVTITQAAVVNPAFGIRIVTNGDKIAVDYSQLEVLGFATSPIATTTVAVARNADVATILVSKFPYNQNLGTLFVQSIPNWPVNNTVRWALISPDNGFNYYPAITTNGGGFNIRADSGTVFAGNSQPTVQGTLYKVAAAFQSGDQAVASNGGNLATGNTVIPGAFNTPMTAFDLGFDYTYAPASQWLQQVKYWPQRLPNQQLIQMTR